MFTVAINPFLVLLLLAVMFYLVKTFNFMPGGMTLLVPDVGEVQLLTMALSKATVETQTLKLYVNNYTPVEASTAANFTEMSTHGYAAKTLVRATWSIASAAGVTTASYAQQTWTFTAAAAVTVYGYLVIETTSTILLWAELFANGQVIQNTGDQILLTPKITLE
ncbi:MAG: hypothetical protein V1799_07750 [bacterium]